ncbi:MAG: sigma factor-like helix-turn-helix DNA-binding protein [Patescibacteria group bacterium]
MVSKAINNLVVDLKPREREVLVGRFGLDDGERKTLAALGEKYGITRERVRQIENDGLNLLNKKLQDELISRVLNQAISHLENVGGLRQEDYFLNDLRYLLGDKNLNYWHLQFLFEVNGKPHYYNEDDDFHGFWYLDDKNLKQAVGLIDRLIRFLEQKKEELLNQRKFEIVLTRFIEPHPVPDFIALNYVLISKNFGTNPFGDFGLRNWGEINPKTIRHKAYLIMKRYGQPMHFAEIAQAINKVGFDKRKALPQTVHNELIKYPEFILVGRGLYGLKDFGFVSGASRDIIKNILKLKGPLPFDKIVDLVSLQRHIKKGTIALHLSNKKHFKKLPNGKYSVIR